MQKKTLFFHGVGSYLNNKLLRTFAFKHVEFQEGSKYFGFLLNQIDMGKEITNWLTQKYWSASISLVQSITINRGRTTFDKVNAGSNSSILKFHGLYPMRSFGKY